MTQEMVDRYIKELLFGPDFFMKYDLQLKSLFQNASFQSLIESIHLTACPSREADAQKEKAAARKLMYESGALFEYPELSEITDSVSSLGYAKNSALISVYFAMRIMALKGGMTSPTPKAATSRSDVDFRLKWPAEYRCDDGHYVRSKNEALVDNWLYNHGICHAYEKAVFSSSDNTVYCSDFFVPSRNLYIEIWGLNDEAYEQRKLAKQRFYDSEGYQLLSIGGDQIKCLDDVLSQALLRCR